MTDTPLIKKIVYALFALNLLLLLASILITWILKNSGETEFTIISSSDINTRFKRSLHSFNLGDEWIKKQKSKDSLFSYNVDVPKDLPIPLLIREITNSFDTTEAVFE
ncbi:MAG: hypothetical protein ACM3RX_00100, partial [Methanococcaceae archaeon]